MKTWNWQGRGISKSSAGAGLSEKVPVIYFVSGQENGGKHIYILIVECV